MPRHTPTRPTRRAEGRPDSYGSGSTSDAAAGEEKCTTVAIRLRPLNEREKAAKQSRIWRCVPTHNSVTQTAPDGNPLPDAKGSTFFTYDRIFDEDSSTQQVYEGVAQEIVHSVVRGLNGTIFAYGQTSSGKTFTMQGGDNNRTPGIVQMAARDLFDLMEQAPDRVFLMRVSYLEIYQEDIKDLLNPESSKLQVREDPRKGVYIDAHEEVVSDFSHVLGILNAGEKQRHVGCTEMNSRSSRSHTLFRLVVESQEHYAPDIHSAPEDVDPAVLVATLNLVDLAGSESVRHTGATGQRQKEGGKINQSLLTLSRVIQTLSQGGTAHVNYRDSKLTRILQPSLSGNAGMAIICCATAAEGYLEETRSTLQFASRAKEIKTRAIVNEVLDDKAQLRRMSQELAALKRQQAEGENGSALVETLQAEKAEQAAKIERLTNLLINNAPVNETAKRHVKRSPRYRRNKRSRETWCPGEGGVPLPLALLDPNSRIPDITEEDFENARKRRSTASAGTPGPKARSTGGPPRTPLTGRRGASATTPGFMSPARARAQQDVVHMRERLADLQAERDAKVAEAEAAAVEIARVKQLEKAVSQREEEVALLKDQLESASRAAEETAEAAAAAASAQATELARNGPADMSEDDDRVGAIAAQLEEAVKAKEALEAELTEFGEYTDMRDQEMVEMKERMTVMEEGLRQKEAELAAIHASEEREEAENARRAEELQERVLELEAAIKERDGSVDRMNTSEDGAEEQKDEELMALKAALEACQEELAEHMTRANDAEEELEKLVEELSSTKARLAEEREAAERAAHEAASAVEAATEAAEAAFRREQDAASASQERVAALEFEKTELQEQEAKLRAGNEEAAALLAEHEAYLSQIADADAQNDPGSTARSKEEVEEAKRAVATAQADVAERDRLLAGLEGRVGELEGSLADARTQQREQEIRSKEDRDRADASLIETLTGQRRAEDALSAAYQSQLEMRCRLEEAVQNLEVAEAERDEMAEARSEAKAKVKEVAALEGCVADRDARLVAVEQARDAAASLADEARRQVDDHEAAAEARESRITELAAVVEELRADNEHRALLEKESEAFRAEQLATLLSEKQEMEKVLLEARADGESLKLNMEALAAKETDSRVDEVSEKLAASEANAEAARVQLSEATAAASLAEAKNIEEIARLVEEAEIVKERSAAAQSQLEAKVQEVAALTEGAASLETRASAAEQKEAADTHRIRELETQMETTQEQLAEALSEAEKAALEGDAKNAEEIARMVKEVQNSKEESSAFQLQLEAKAGEFSALTETTESLKARLSAAEAAAGEKEVANAARIGEMEAEMKAAHAQLAEALAGAKSMISEAEAKNAAETARMFEQVEAAQAQSAVAESQLEAKAQEVSVLTDCAESLEARLSAAEAAAEERGAADAARIEGAEAEMKTAQNQLAEALAIAERTGTEAEAMAAKKITKLVEEVEASKGESAAVQSKLEAKVQEVLALTKSAESLETRLAAAEAVAEEKGVADAACIEGLEAEVKTAQDQLAEALARVEDTTTEAEAMIAEKITKLVEEVEASKGESAAVQSKLEAKEREVLDLTECAESLEARLSAAGAAAAERGAVDAARIEGVEAEMKTAQDQLAITERTATEAEAVTAEKITKLVEEVEASKGESAAVQSNLEAKEREVLDLTECAESLEARLSAAEAAAEERGAVDAARIEGVEAEMKTAQDQLAETLAITERTATEAEAMTAEKITKLVEEVEALKGESAAVQSNLEAKEREVLALTECAESLEARLSAAEAAAEERGAVDAARIEGLEAEMKTAQDQLAEALAIAERTATEAEAMTSEKITKLVEEVEASKGVTAAVQSNLEAKVQEVLALTESAESLEARLSAAEAAAEEKGVADAARIEGLEAEVKTAQDQLVEALGRAEGMATEAEATTAEKLTKLVEEVEASKGESAAAQSNLEAKVQEVLALTESAESLETRLSAAEAAAEEKGVADAARIEGLEAEVKTAQDQLTEALARAEGMATEAEATTAEKITKLVEEVEASKGESAAVQSKLEAKEREVLALTESAETLEARLSAAEAAAEERGAVDAARVEGLEAEMKMAQDQLVEAFARAEGIATETEAMTAEKLTKLVEEVEASKGESVAVQSKLEAKVQEVLALTERAESLETRLSATEATAEEKMAAGAACIGELEAKMQAVHDQLGEASNEAEHASTRAFELASEAEAAGQLVAALEKAMADAAAVHEAETGETRAALELAEASLATKDEDIARAQQQAADELRETRDAAAAAAVDADEAAVEKEATIAALEEKLKEQEVVGSELTQALEDSENLSKDVLDLTDQLVEKEAKLSAEAAAVAELQQQIETASTEIANLKESIASSISAGNSNDIEDNNAELRRLRVDLDKRGSELDTAMKDAAVARAELKEMKGMLTAAEAGAGAAGADEDSLRKRLSQLVCENGLLKGEKERFETLSRQAASESKTSSSRAASDVERLEREVEGLRKRADKASDLAADGERVKAALGAMEARMGEVRQERAELQEATQRYLARCSAAESEANTLRERLAEIQGRDQSRDAVISLETRVDELEEDVRRATASKVEVEGEVRASANRVKRLQGEVDMMRSEYEIVSEEAMGLRGSLVATEAKLEEALSASQAVPDRSEELEAEIARLLDARAGLEAAHETALAAERAARDDVEAQREAAIGDKEAEIANLEADYEALCHAQREERLEVRAQRDADIRVLEEAVADAEDAFARSEAEKKELSKEVRAAAAAVAAGEDSLRAASEGLAASEEKLAEAIDAGKAMRDQLRHRLDTQVAEAENLREEVAASRERADRAEASVRASEQRAREGADEKTKGLLEEMENLCQEKLLAENRADEMEAELERLRDDVACAEQRAAREQSKIISASKQHMAGLEEAAAKKDRALEELQASLEASRDAEVAAAQTAEALAEKTRSATEAVAALRTQAEENERVLEQKDARIKHLEGVRLTKDQVDKLQAMKVSARNTAAENKALKERLAALGAGKGGGGASGEAIAQAAALSGANERIDELQGAKNNLMEKLRQYGKRLHELEKEHARVRAAVEKAGYSAPEGCDLGDAVLEIAERSAGTDGSMMSSFSGGEGSAIAAAVAASEKHQAEMEDAMAALQSKEAERLAVQEQMRAGVARFRVLEAKEASARERLEAVEAEHREAVSVALRAKEKDHERQLKFLQEENVTLFQENSDMKAKADKYKAEVQALQGKVASVQAPESATKKRPCADRTNVPIPPPTTGKPGTAAPQHTAAADRRARSRALLESPAVADEEGAGECSQS